MRTLLLLASLFLAACSSPAPAPETAPEGRSPSISSAWECDPKSAGLWNCTPASRPAAKAVPAPVPAPAEVTAEIPPEPEPVAMAPAPVVQEPLIDDEIDVDDGYILQVGAFSTRESAMVAVDEIGLEQLRVIPTRRGNEDWYVLVLGTYNSRVDAREAGEAYLRTYPKGSIWVRSAADLRESRVDS